MTTIAETLAKIAKDTRKTGLNLQATPRPQNISAVCQPDCLICGGFGWIRRDVPISDPEFGRLQPCPNLDLSKSLGEKCGISPEDRGLNWDSIRNFGDAGRARDVVRSAVGRGWGWVYLWGDYGLAKTLILKTAIAVTLRNLQYGAYTRMSSLLEHLRAAYDEKDPQRASLDRLDWYAGLQIIAIDEFDRVRDTAYGNEKKFELMDRRYEDAIRKKSVTLIASNKPPETLDGYLADRIKDGRFVVFKVEGQSMRPQFGRETEGR